MPAEGLAPGALATLLSKIPEPTPGELESVTRSRGIPADLLKLVKVRRLPVLPADAKVLSDGSAWRALLCSGWLIPYPGEEFARVRLDRPSPGGPRYLCPPGSQPVPYAPAPVAPGRIVLAEGEFKALALVASGIQAIGLGGISALAGRFDELRARLKGWGSDPVVVGFDREDWATRGREGRWEPATWAVVTAKVFGGLVTLPPEGSKDWDDAMAKSLNLKAAVDAAEAPEAWIAALPGDGPKAVKRAVERYFFRSCVEPVPGGYVRVEYEDGVRKTSPVADFKMRLLRVVFDPDVGVVREFELRGLVKKVGTADPAHLSNCGAFREWTLALGPFHFLGGQRDLDEILRRISLDDHEEIEIPDHVGWQDRNRCWLFQGCAILPDGKRVASREDGTVDLPSGVSLRPRALWVSSGEERLSTGLPRIPTAQPLGMRESANMIGETLREPYIARIALGWIAASLHSHDVFRILHHFPFLFLVGRRNTGKSSLCRWLMAAAGLERAADSASETTQVAASRQLAYLSSLPYWLDDWRPDRKIEGKTAWLLSVYNRQTAGKGIRTPFGVRSTPVRGTLLLSGEAVPGDNALATRCLIIRLKPGQFSSSHYDRLNLSLDRLGGCAGEVLGSPREKVREWLQSILEVAAWMTERGVDARTAANWAIPVTAWNAFGEPDEGLAEWAVAHARTARIERDEESLPSQVWEELSRLRLAGRIDGRHVRFDDVAGHLFVALRPAWVEYAEALRRRNEEPLPYSDWVKCLREEPWVFRLGTPSHMTGGTARCAVLLTEGAPDSVRELAGLLPIGADPDAAEVPEVHPDTPAPGPAPTAGPEDDLPEALRGPLPTLPPPTPAEAAALALEA